MGWRGVGAAFALVCAIAGVPHAFAADISSVTTSPAQLDSFGIETYAAPPPQPYITPVQELRLGVFAHNTIHDEDAPVDVSIEVLSSPLRLWDTTNPWIAWFFYPRLNAGGMVNTGGGTSYGFLGLTWRIPIYGRFFFEGEFGGAVNNAPTYAKYDRVDMGCRFTFRESGGFGYQFTDAIDLIASIEHVSHATFCTHINPGLTQVGVRVGYKF
jgi:lipid A 3-O-deacylase